MPVTPVSNMALHLAGIRAALEESAVFSAACVAESSTAAARIKYVQNQDTLVDGELPKPFIVLSTPKLDADYYEAGCFEQNSMIVVAFFDKVREDDQDDDTITYLNLVGGTLQDVMSTAGTGGHYKIESINETSAPSLIVKAKQTEAYRYWSSGYSFLIKAR